MKIRHNFILGYILILIVGLSTLANNQTITITAQSDFDFIEQFNDNTLNWLTQDDTNVTANIVDGKYRITMPEDGDIHQFITYPDFSTAPKVMGDYEYRFEISEGSCGEPEFCFLIMAFNVREGQDQMTYVLYISRERRLLYRFNGNRIQGTRTDSSDLPDVFNGGTHNSVVRATADELTWHVNNRLIARFTGATEFNGTIGFGVTRYSDNSRALSLAFDNVTIQSIGNRPALIASPTPLTIANNTSDNFNNAVNLYWQNNDSEGALSLFDEVISSNQTLADAYAWRAKIRLEATTIARNEIERDINTALDIDPDNALALAVRSIYAMYNRNQASATRDIERALAIAPDNVDVISAIAQAYTFGYMHEEALAILQTLNPFPDYPRLYYQRALVYLLGLQDSDNAKLDLQRTIQLDNSFVNAYISLAQIYFQEEQPILVLENILRARQFDPNAGVDYANRVFLNYWFVRPSDFEGIVNISTTGLNIPITSRYTSVGIPVWYEEISNCYSYTLEKALLTGARRYQLAGNRFILTTGFIFGTEQEAQEALEQLRTEILSCGVSDFNNVDSSNFIFSALDLDGAIVGQYIRISNFIITFSINSPGLLGEVTQSDIETFIPIFSDRLTESIATFNAIQSAPVNTPTPTLTPSITFTPSITPTPSMTFTPSLTPTPSLTFTPSATFTPSSTPTPSNTPRPTNTPTLTPTASTCQGNLAPRMVVGENGRVILDGTNTSNRLRNGAGTGFSEITRIQPGEEFEVIGGPECANGYTWWQVDYNGRRGWTAESGDGRYWIEPILPETSTGDGQCFARAGSSNVNLRTGPGTNNEVGGRLNANTQALIVSQTINTTGNIWYELANGLWVRNDVIQLLGDCDNVPES